METGRREFLGLVFATTAAASSGCVGGPSENDADGTEDGGDESTPPETAEFGYETWVPTGEYRNLGYADLTRLREYASLEMDTRTAPAAGGTGPRFADVDAYIATDDAGAFGTVDSSEGNAFDAFHGSFDAEALTERLMNELSEPDETEVDGYTVVRGTTTDEGGPTGVEVALSESFVVSSQADGVATRVIDAAAGETEREADTAAGGELMQGLEEYADDPPLVVFNYGSRNTKYSFVETRDGVLRQVDVTVQKDAETAKEVQKRQDPSLKYNDTVPGEDRINTTRDGRILVISQETSLSNAENYYFSEAGPFP